MNKFQSFLVNKESNFHGLVLFYKKYRKVTMLSMEAMILKNSKELKRPIAVASLVILSAISNASLNFDWTKYLDQQGAGVDVWETWNSTGNTPGATVYHDFISWHDVEDEKVGNENPPWTYPYSSVGMTTGYTTVPSVADSTGAAGFTVKYELANNSQTMGRQGWTLGTEASKSARDLTYKLLWLNGNGGGG